MLKPHPRLRETSTGTAGPGASSLSPRAAEVLREVVEVYLESGEPVGSQLIAEHAGGAMSSATIRVVLAELADHGYLSQPHTSAGRVPTPPGLRFYLDLLMRLRVPSPRARQEVDLALREAGPTPAEILRAGSQHLAAALELAALARRPRMEALRLLRLSLVSLGPGRLLAVAVFEEGSVHHRLVELEHDETDLARVQNVFDEELAGLTLAAARARIRGDVEPSFAAGREAGGPPLQGLDERTRALTESALPTGDSPDDAVIVCGQTHMVERAPNTEQAGDVLRALDDKRLLLRLLDGLAGAEGTQVLLGEEMSSAGLTACSVVAAPYFVGTVRGGTVAIVGPLRLEYSRVIPLVTYTAAAISGILRSVKAAA